MLDFTHIQRGDPEFLDDAALATTREALRDRVEVTAVGISRRARYGFSVRPRYTPGSPALVDVETALHVARSEVHAYTGYRDGYYGESGQLTAERLGLANIVYVLSERANKWSGFYDPILDRQLGIDLSPRVADVRIRSHLGALGARVPDVWRGCTFDSPTLSMYRNADERDRIRFSEIAYYLATQQLAGRTHVYEWYKSVAECDEWQSDSVQPLPFEYERAPWRFQRRDCGAVFGWKWRRARPRCEVCDKNGQG